MMFKRPNPANPTLRGADSLPPKANGAPRFKFLPVEIIERPKQFSKSPIPASNKVLAMQLTNVGHTVDRSWAGAASSDRSHNNDLRIESCLLAVGVLSGNCL